MCWALVAGMAAQGASSTLNAEGNRKIRERQRGYRDDERARQGAYQAEAAGSVADSISRFGHAQQDLATTTDQRNTVLQGLADKAGASDYAGAEGAPEVVKSDIARRIADAMSRGRDQIKAQAAVGATGQNQFNNQVALHRSGQDLARLASFAGGSAGVLPFELNYSMGAGDNDKKMADFFRAAGSTLSSYGMANMAGGPKTMPTDSIWKSPGGYSVNVSSRGAVH